MARVYRSSVPAPELGPDFEKWAAEEAAYIERVKATIPKENTGSCVGQIARFVVGDGFAQYLVWKEKPLTLVWLEVGDKWQASAATLRGFRLTDLQQQIARDQFWADQQRQKNTFYDDLPIGAIVHYHDGFAQFVRCERVKGEVGERLRPIALIGNWRQHDVAIHRGGRVDLGYHVKCILERNCFEPHPSNIWEQLDEGTRAHVMRGCQPGLKYEVPFDPTTAEPWSLEPPPLTEEETQIGALALRANRLREALEGPFSTREDYVAAFWRVQEILRTEAWDEHLRV